MTTFAIDFDKLNAQVTIQQVAEKMLGIRLKPFKDELRGCCPISQNTNPRSFCITPAMNRYVCFCDECKKFPRRGGDAIELVLRMRRYDKPLAAAKEIAKHFGLYEPAAEIQPEPRTETKNGFDPLAYQKRLQPDHEALKKCGVTAETIREWGGGYVTGGALGGRLALLPCDIEGTIKGFVGVALKGEEPELKYPQGVMVPVFLGVQMVQEGLDLHIVYHPLDALRYSEDDYNVLALLTPVTRDVLTSLTALMDTKGITGVEFH